MKSINRLPDYHNAPYKIPCIYCGLFNDIFLHEDTTCICLYSSMQVYSTYRDLDSDEIVSVFRQWSAGNSRDINFSFYQNFNVSYTSFYWDNNAKSITLLGFVYLKSFTDKYIAFL